MATFLTYDMKGQKLSFANWISNLSPTETPFCAMTAKEAVDQVKFSWQTDRLSKPAANAQKEGDVAQDGSHFATKELENYTQILRKVVRVTDTAAKIGLYGRQSETPYQMEKAGEELKRDLESALLNNPLGTIGSTSTARQTSGVVPLIAGKYVADPDTGAIVHSGTVSTLEEKDIWTMAYNLYLSGSKADTIMFHPKHMAFFSSLASSSATNVKRTRMFKNLENKFNLSVSVIRSPLGQEFTLIPNRFIDENNVFFFTPSDWTQMLFRAPEKTELAKTGSSTKYMIEMEVGLRHRNPYASGIIEIGGGLAANVTVVGQTQFSANGTSGWSDTIPGGTLVAGSPVDFYVRTNPATLVASDDGSYDYQFLMATVGSGGLSLVNDPVDQNKAHITGTTPLDQAGLTFSVNTTVVDSDGTSVTGTALSGTWA